MKSYWSRTNRREEAEGGEDNEGKRWGGRGDQLPVCRENKEEFSGGR